MARESRKPSKEILEGLFEEAGYVIARAADIYCERYELEVSTVTFRRWLIADGIITPDPAVNKFKPESPTTPTISEKDAKNLISATENSALVRDAVEQVKIQNNLARIEDFTDEHREQLAELVNAKINERLSPYQGPGAPFDEPGAFNPDLLPQGDLPRFTSTYKPEDNDFTDEDELPTENSYRMIETPVNQIRRVDTLTDKLKVLWINEITSGDFFEKEPGDVSVQEKLEIVKSLMDWKVEA